MPIHSVTATAGSDGERQLRWNRTVEHSAVEHSAVE